MKVLGVESKRITVEITPKECIKGLSKEYKLDKILFPPKHIYWKPEYGIDKSIVKLVKLRFNIHQGCYESTGEFIDDKFTLEIYTHLKPLQKLIYDSDIRGDE